MLAELRVERVLNFGFDVFCILFSMGPTLAGTGLMVVIPRLRCAFQSLIHTRCPNI